MVKTSDLFCVYHLLHRFIINLIITSLISIKRKILRSLFFTMEGILSVCVSHQVVSHSPTAHNLNIRLWTSLPRGSIVQVLRVVFVFSGKTSENCNIKKLYFKWFVCKHSYLVFVGLFLMMNNKIIGLWIDSFII